MKFVRSVFALLALVTVSACAASPQVPAPVPVPVVEDVKVAPAQAQSEDLSGLPRSYVVYFDTDSTEIRASTMQVLWEAAQNASRLKPLTIRVQGFTDGAGNRAYNQRLSERRAAAVAAQLAKLGVGIKVETSGLGESAAKQRDAGSRRVEITFEGAGASVALPASGHTVQAALATADAGLAMTASSAFAAISATIVPPVVPTAIVPAGPTPFVQPAIQRPSATGPPRV